MQKQNKEYQMTRAEKIEYFSKLNDIPTLGNGNGKTGKGCLTWSLPVEPTCDHNAPCYKNKVCYCLKGCQVFANVVGAYYKNWRLYNEDPVSYEEKCTNIIKYSGLKLVRIHDSGDIPDKEYLELLVRVANKLPNVKFLAYTKKYDIVNDWLDEGNEFPANFTMRFSMCDKDWVVPNPHNLPLAYIDFEDKSLNPEIPKNAYRCKGTADPKDQEHTCSICQMCWRKNVKNVVFGQH